MRGLALTVAATLALIWLALFSSPDGAADPVVLLTDGATLDMLAAEGITPRPGGSTYALGRDHTRPPWVEPIDDLGVVLRRHPTAESLVIAGHGLDPWDTARLPALGPTPSLLPHAVPPIPAGVSIVSWHRDLRLGAPLVVDGRVSGESPQGSVVRLAGPGGSTEVTVEPEAGTFTLELVPPGTGRFLFELTVTTSDDRTTRIGHVDAEVRDEPPGAVLWLENAPSFETRYTKRWLADRGGVVAIRSTVSRNRHHFEYHNIERTELSRLTADRLKPFALVVVDDATWRTMPAREREAILEQLHEGRLGLILRADLGSASTETSVLPFGLAARRIDGLDELMVRLAVGNVDPQPIAVAPYEIVTGERSRAVFSDRAGRSLAAVVRHGRGEVVLTLLTGSYRWILEGRRDAHRAYWTAVLEAATPPSTQPRWIVPPHPLRTDEPFEIVLAGTLGSTPVVLIDPAGREQTVPLRQHPTRPDRLAATLWPRSVGWHQLAAGEATASFHVDRSTSWNSWRLAERQRATKLAAARSKAPAEPGHTALPWARLLPFAALVGMLGWLWVDERRGGKRAQGRTA